MEDQDGNMTFTFVDPLKVEVKVEVNDGNPWYVEHASAFLQYCCPECEYKNGTLKSFEDHALQNHENARVLFANNYKVETKVGEYLPSRLKIQTLEDRAVDSFSNPGVLAVIAKLQIAEIRLCPFSEPSNSGGALAPPAPPLSTPLS